MHTEQIATAAGLVAELADELRTHAYGIRSPEQPAIVDGRAQTTLILLDDEASIGVALSSSGYAVTRVSHSKYEKSVGVLYETLTALLSALSPAFNSAMHRALCSRLGEIEAAQGDSDEDEG
ncbi:hypothetical protein IWW39_001911 [Coemansia spiralis]|uniref:GSKIP domain-containing protein n=1 Tax=Coemansia spiralis TaxID=417178 RepID=A0A9W8L631_9FUNG|nr:hypothetical protein IWW39_001911 [Coemansia spiralis]